MFLSFFRFNIENPIFVDLFPELTKEINDKLAKEDKPLTKNKDEPCIEQTDNGSNNRSNSLIDKKNILQSIILNVVLVFAFIIIIFLIKYIINLTA